MDLESEVEERSRSFFVKKLVIGGASTKVAYYAKFH